MTLKINPNTEEKLTFIWKIIWEIWWTLTRVAESLKTWTLMDYSFRKYVVFEIKNTKELFVKNDVMT